MQRHLQNCGTKFDPRAIHVCTANIKGKVVLTILGFFSLSLNSGLPDNIRILKKHCQVSLCKHGFWGGDSAQRETLCSEGR